METLSSLGGHQDEQFVDTGHPQVRRQPGRVRTGCSGELSPVQRQTQRRKSISVHLQAVLSRVQGFVCRGLLTDVTLVAGERTFPCHRLLLAASSDYFAAMFTGGMVEQGLDRVVIQGVEAGALAQLIDYCYSGKIDLQVTLWQGRISYALFFLVYAPTHCKC